MQKSHIIIIVVLVIVLGALAAWAMFVRQTPGTPGGVEGAGGLAESGRAHLDAGEYEAAIADLEAAIEADPGDSEAHFMLGQAYNRTNDLLNAADEFRTVIALDPDNAAVRKIPCPVPKPIESSYLLTPYSSLLT